MSGNQVQRGWEERVISTEKGNRIVHYLIKDTTGVSILAVVGVEKSIRHMTYWVTEDFLRVFGSTSAVHAGTRWKSKGKVIECLTSAVSGNGPIFADSNQQIIESTPHLKDLMAIMTRLSKRRTLQNEQQAQGSRQSEDNSDIVWSGEPWICSKNLKHYSSFVRSDIKIPVYSFVWIMSEQKNDFLAYVEDLYEDQRGKKMVRVRWFNTCEEIEGRVAKLYPQSREIFMTPTEQDISAETVDGIAAVLNPSDFKRCDDCLPQSLAIQNFMCHREIIENEVKAFSLSKLRGYSVQPILYSLKCEVTRLSNKKDKSSIQVQASTVPKGTLAQGPKRCRSIQVAVTGGQITPISDQIAKPEPSGAGIRVKMLGNKHSDASTIAAPAETLSLPRPPKRGEKKIELLSQDSGLRGCWFRCKVLRSSQKMLKVQYNDVDDVDGPGKLVEWVPACRVAPTDKLEMRHDGRLTVRPWPDWDSSDIRFEVGAAVDAWWCDGWWEGVVIGCDTTATSNLELYLPGEKKFLTTERKNIRVSKDWIDNRWVSVDAKPDILSFLSSSSNPVARLPLPVLATNQVNSSVPAATDQAAAAPSSIKPRDGKGKSPVSSSSRNAVDELNLKKLLIINENQEQSRKGSGSGAGKNGGKGKSVTWSKTAKK